VTWNKIWIVSCGYSNLCNCHTSVKQFWYQSYKINNGSFFTEIRVSNKDICEQEVMDGSNMLTNYSILRYVARIKTLQYDSIVDFWVDLNQSYINFSCTLFSIYLKYHYLMFLDSCIAILHSLRLNELNTNDLLMTCIAWLGTSIRLHTWSINSLLTCWQICTCFVHKKDLNANIKML
jgi:hypothetical protein